MTIGYGDLYPESNLGKPFFVLWTLIAVPSVTILISNMGDTVVAWVQKGTMWLGQRTILPERSLRSDTDTRSNPTDSRRTRIRTRLRQKGFWPLKSPENVEKAVHSEEAREVDEGAVPDPSRTQANGEGENKEIRGDIEKLGDAVETVEAERGQGGGIAARLAREIKLVSKDLGKQPPKEYEWEDWKRWMRLLSVSSDDNDGSNGRRGLGGLKSLKSPTRSMGARSPTHSDASRSSGWIWLGDDGPLFSQESEANWILGKLCDRLEQVLMKEVLNARTAH